MPDPNSDLPDKGGKDAELRKLCDQYPDFSEEEWEEDQAWLRATLESGEMLDGKPAGKLVGKLVAVYRAKVVATGTDETAIRVALSKKYKAHPGRFVVQRVERRSAPKKVAAAGCSIVQVALMLALAAVVGIAAISAMGSKANETFSMIGSGVRVN